MPHAQADRSHFIVNNILEGHVWFFVPASLVICNDVMAYVCGKLTDPYSPPAHVAGKAFGRTPLIKLSPKKTVEGFVGAFICTLLFALLVSISRFSLNRSLRAVGHLFHAIPVHDLPGS